MIEIISWLWRWMVVSTSSCFSADSLRRSISSAKPKMLAIGVRSSCAAVDRNSLFI